MAAIRFLTTVSKSVHHTLFGDAGALQQICESIIVPNLRVRPEDEEVRGLYCGYDCLPFSFPVSCSFSCLRVSMGRCGASASVFLCCGSGCCLLSASVLLPSCYVPCYVYGAFSAASWRGLEGPLWPCVVRLSSRLPCCLHVHSPILETCYISLPLLTSLFDIHPLFDTLHHEQSIDQSTVINVDITYVPRCLT